MQLQPGTLLQGRYRVDGLIAQGGMGAVYRAVDERLGNSVALKQTLMGDPALRAAFEREARLLAGLQHPALPVVSDHFAEDGGQFLVMQYIPGDDLAALLRARGAPFPAPQVMAWADEILDALSYLHARQPPVIHRDIKPQNLKLAPHGGVVVLDFGLAKGAGGPSVGPSPSLYGYTPQYAPIEQIQGSGTDARSDLYSLAATLAELLTGQAPPDALTRAAAAVRGESDPLRPLHELNPMVPPHASAVLGRALALNPALRPPSAAAMRADLRSVVPSQAAAHSGGGQAARPTLPVTAPPAAPVGADQGAATGPTVALARPARRPLPIMFALAALGLLLALAGGALLAVRAPAGTAPAGAAGEATVAPAPPARGASFADPVPYGQTGAYGPLALRVLDTQRGREAWNSMRKANQFNDPPPTGYEYFLVKLALEAAAEAPPLYVRLAGERRVLYRSGGVSPAALPEAMAAGQRAEAWVPFVVVADEADLVLHIDTVASGVQLAPLHMAADEGARLAPDPAIEQILPDERGVRHSQPAPLGQTVVAEDYELTLLEVRRGPAALEALVANYADVKRPQAGHEYALARLRVRYIGDGGAIGWASLGPSDVSVARTGAADPADGAIDHPAVYVLPDDLPALDVLLLPAGQAEGWTVLELPIGARDVAMVFSPGFDPNGLNTRYLALE